MELKKIFKPQIEHQVSNFTNTGFWQISQPFSIAAVLSQRTGLKETWERLLYSAGLNDISF